MKYLFSLILILLLFIDTTYSQNVVGKVIDNYKNPIAYATVQINKDNGVLSNDEGEFSINISKFKSTDIVVISYLGYKQISIPLSEFKSKEYILEEDVNELSEIFISNKKYTLDEILLKVKENIKTNYIKKPKRQQIFHRNSSFTKFKRFEFEFKKSSLLSKKSLRKINKSIDSMTTININKSSKDYSEDLTELFSSNKATKMSVTKATRLVNKQEDKSSDMFQGMLINTIASHLEKGATYKVKSGILKIADSLKFDDDLDDNVYKDKKEVANLKSSIKNIINSNDIQDKVSFDFLYKTNKYNFELKGQTVMDDENIYIIKFKPKKSSARYKGTLYVNAYDFAVIKSDFEYAEGKRGVRVNMKLLLGIEFMQTKRNIEIYYHKNENDTYSLKLIKQESGAYMYFKRSLKFTKNRKVKSEDKKMIKIGFLMETEMLSKDELFFITEDFISAKEFENFKEKKEYKVDYISKYNSEIWKGYNILSPVQEIKDYDTGKSNK